MFGVGLILEPDSGFCSFDVLCLSKQMGIENWRCASLKRVHFTALEIFSRYILKLEQKRANTCQRWKQEAFVNKLSLDQVKLVQKIKIQTNLSSETFWYNVVCWETGLTRTTAVLENGRIRLKKGEILDWSTKEEEVRSCTRRWMGLNRIANTKDTNGIGK